jgi:hypothetical protein
MSASSVLQTSVPAAPRPQDFRDLQTALYRKIGISAVAAVLKITNEARATDARKRPAHPLPALLQGHDMAA